MKIFFKKYFESYQLGDVSILTVSILTFYSFEKVPKNENLNFEK